MGEALIRLIVLDSGQMHSQAISMALSKQEFEITYAGCDPREAVAEVNRQRSDVALVSDKHAGRQFAGFGLIGEIVRACPKLQVVMLLERSDRESVAHAFRVGARGVFPRSSTLELLSKCLTCVYQGELWASSSDVEHLVETVKMPLQIVSATGNGLLSKREGEVVRRISEGLTNREIAHLLGLSEYTIKNYVYRIFDKLGISSRVELALYAASKFVGEPSEREAERDQDDSFKDDAALFRWCCNAVEKFTIAQYVLGELYRDGRGTPCDAQAAYAWFRIAEELCAVMEHRSRQACLDLESVLTRRQVEDATRKAVNWLQKQGYVRFGKLEDANPPAA